MRPEGFIEKLNKRLTRPLARKLKGVYWITPDRITWFSFLVSGVLGPLAILEGHLPLAGLLVLLGAWLDSLDGDLARERNVVSREGAILDAVLDRYIDLFLISALIISCGRCLLPGLLSLIGSALVPYTRAKVEAMGKASVATFASRDVRNLILVAGLLLNQPYLMLWGLAVLSNISALHRFVMGVRK